MSYGNGTI
jgi:hypothetical protein